MLCSKKTGIQKPHLEQSGKKFTRYSDDQGTVVYGTSSIICCYYATIPL